MALLGYKPPMTDAEFRAFLAAARAEVDASLAQLAQLDWNALPPAERAALEARRQGYLDLRAAMADESITAELEATEHAGRDLAPDEVRALRRRQ